MPGPSSSKSFIHHVHIADGFSDDCEELIHRWLKTDTLTYESFCEIWKDMQFSFLYHGRTSGAELAELSEELLQIAKHYMVSNTDNFEESVAGLFLVYALLRLQPYARFAALRVAPEDAPALARIETQARRQRRYDVLYILGSVLIEGPVQYHAFNRERGMETAIRKYLEGTTGIDRLGVRPKGVFYRQNEESDLLRELNIITKRYTEAKKNIGGSGQGLNYADENLATDLHTSLKEVINGIVEEGPEGNKKMQDHYSKVQEIKEKAMRQAVKGVKHLSSVANRKKRENRIKKSPSNATKPKKSTLGTNCLLPTFSRLPAKRKRKPSTSSDSDGIFLTSDEELPDQTSSEEQSQDETQEITANSPQREEREERVDIKINALPVFTRTEDNGSMFEIEVIDNMNQPSTSTQGIDKTQSPEKVDPLEGTSKEKRKYRKRVDAYTKLVKTSESLQIVPVENKTESVQIDLFEINTEDTPAPKVAAERTRGRKKKECGAPEELMQTEVEETESRPNVKRRDRRDLKQPAIMSKFKKLGMLGMVNCEDELPKSE